MITVSGAYSLSAAALGNVDLPIIGWKNLVTFTNVSADNADASYPVTNLSNPSTAARWKGSNTSLNHLTVLFGSEQSVEYLAVARHNWGSGAVVVSVEGLSFGADPVTGWTQIVGEQRLPDDSPALFRFIATPLIGIRFKLQPAAVIPYAAVLFTGLLLVLQHGIPTGHTPINYGRTTTTLGVRSQGGDFLGTVVLNAALASSIVQQNLDPTWYRANLEPFRLASDDATFFWAWSPRNFPNEVGYCSVTNDPQPVISQLPGHIDITFNIAGVAL
jgi:hypothetical protein